MSPQFFEDHCSGNIVSKRTTRDVLVDKLSSQDGSDMIGDSGDTMLLPVAARMAMSAVQ